MNPAVWMRSNLTMQGYCLSDAERRELQLDLRFSIGLCLTLVVIALALASPVMMFALGGIGAIAGLTARHPSSRSGTTVPGISLVDRRCRPTRPGVATRSRSLLPGWSSAAGYCVGDGRLECAMARITVDELLARQRRGLTRLHPNEATVAMRAGATLVDIRSDSQIARDGVVPGALVIARNVLEWRLDPASDYRDPRAPDPADHVILMCDEGYQSSLAAATLQQLGFEHATDLAGGFQAWRAAGLPVDTTAAAD